MKLITWNVQWCRGVDGRVDPARIVAAARELADFDVLCLQEIADNFPDPRLAGNSDVDQFAATPSKPRHERKSLTVQWVPSVFDYDGSRSVCGMRGGSAIG